MKIAKFKSQILRPDESLLIRFTLHFAIYTLHFAIRCGWPKSSRDSSALRAWLTWPPLIEKAGPTSFPSVLPSMARSFILRSTKNPKRGSRCSWKESKTSGKTRMFPWSSTDTTTTGEGLPMCWLPGGQRFWSKDRDTRGLYSFCGGNILSTDTWRSRTDRWSRSNQPVWKAGEICKEWTGSGKSRKIHEKHPGKPRLDYKDGSRWKRPQLQTWAGPGFPFSLFANWYSLPFPCLYRDMENHDFCCISATFISLNIVKHMRLGFIHIFFRIKLDFYNTIVNIKLCLKSD